jgi:O-acetylserine/cysteine efflux transporter
MTTKTPRDHGHPYLLAALRFVLCVLPAIFLFKRPAVRIRYVFWYGLVLGVLQ